MASNLPRATGPASRVGTGTLRRARRYGSELDRYFDLVGEVELLDAADEVRLAQTIEAGKEARRRLEQDPSAEAADRAELARTVEAGAAARERFVRANLRLVVHLAWRHPGAATVALADLIQDGNLGLLEAVDRFDWRRGYRFSTYAAWWIRQALQRGSASSARLIRLPYPLHEAVIRVSAAGQRLLALTGDDPSVRELALATRLDLRMVARALTVEPDALSLHRRVGDERDSADLGDLAAVASDCPADEVSERVVCAAALRAARIRLDERSRRVLALRFGLDGGEPLSYEAIGAQMGLARESIRLIVKRALAVLRVALGEAEEDEQCRPRLPRTAGRL